MKTWKVRQGNTYIDCIGDGYEIQGGTLLFYENDTNGGVPMFTTSIKEWEYFNELGPRIERDSPSIEERMDAVESKIDNIIAVMDANNL